MTTAKRIAIVAMCVVFVAAAIALGVAGVASTKVYAADVFDYVGTVKTESGSFENGKRGLRIYGYDSGLTANFKNTQTDVFNAELQIGSHDGRKELKKYSVVFTDIKSGKSFAVQVVAYSDYNDVGVVYDGSKAGIVYMERKNAAYGVTAGYNEDGVYTKFSADICSLTFDPSSMQVRIIADDGNYRVVWDFTKQYNDGKLLANDLPVFGEYTVSIVFDEVAANSRGDLMVYSFGGYSLSTDEVSYVPTILLEKGMNPIVGKEFDLPKANVTDGNGNNVSNKVTVDVYDANGVVLSSSVSKFTPQSEGTLYFYYSYNDGQISADLWYKTEAVNADKITADFNYDGELPTAVGVGAKIAIPSATVSSNVLVNGSEQCLVTIKKDGIVLDGYERVDGGFVFSVEKGGNYEVVYGGKLSASEKTETLTFVADENKLAVNVDIQHEFALGTSYEFSAAEFCFGANKQNVSPVIVFPSGKRADGQNVTLDEVGKYKAVYTATFGGEEYTHEEEFLVKLPYVDNFDGQAEYAAMRGNNEYKGVKLSLSNNQTVTYGKEIDLSKYTFSDNTKKGKTLVELNFDPKTIGSTDLDSFYVVLTDKYDSTNYITIRLKYLSYSPLCTYIRVRASNQANWVGYNYDFASTDLQVHAAATHEEGGFVSSASFTHVLDEYDFGFTSLKLYFDYETKCLYSQPLWLTGHDDGNHEEYDSRSVPWLVYDLDASDGNLSAGNKPWSGFTTGEVYLSVYAKGVGSTTDVFVTNIDGEDLSEALFDDKLAPVIDVNVDENNVPTAKVGVAYKVFDFTATDVDSVVVKKSVSVINDSTSKQVALDEDNCFVPLEGTYTLVYYAEDSFGLKTEKRIKVTAKRQVELPYIELDGSLPRTAAYGQTIVLPDYNVVSDGAGNAVVDVSVTCGDVVVSVVNGKFDCIGAVGTYTVTYTVTDYIGQASQIKKKVTVSLSADLSFDEENISLPEAFIAGDNVVFGDYQAYYYNENLEKIVVPASIEIVDGNGKTTLQQGQVYVPATSDAVSTAEVTFNFDKDGKTKRIVRSLPIKTSKNGDNFVANYFAVANADVSSSSNGLMFTSTSEADVTVSFVRPIYAANMMLRLIADAKTLAGKSLTVTFADKFDATKKVQVVYTVENGSWYCSVDSGKNVATDLDESGYLQLNYNNTTCTFTDGNGKTLGAASAVGNENFDGFTSGYVYMSCRVDGGDGVSVGVRSINNQTINSVKRDMQKPAIIVDGKYEGRVASGSTITLLSAEAYDVLNAIGDITVYLKKGNETVMQEKLLVAGDTFTVNDCGSYTLYYKVVDAAGNVATEKVEFAVYDPVKPTLTFAGTIVTEAKKGQSIELPEYSVADNAPDGVKVYVYLFAPDGTRSVVSNSVTFTQSGTYTIVYLAVDANNNSTLYRFIVTVK